MGKRGNLGIERYLRVVHQLREKQGPWYDLWLENWTRAMRRRKEAEDAYGTRAAARECEAVQDVAGGDARESA